MGFLPRRNEPRLAPEPSYDALFFLYLKEEIALLQGDDYLSLRSYLFHCVRSELPHLRERRLDGRAVDYTQGRVAWLAGAARRRPPRGWREGPGSRSLGEPTYLALDELAARALAVWSRVTTDISDVSDTSEASEAGLVEGCFADELAANLQVIEDSLRIGARSRPSALAC